MYTSIGIWSCLLAVFWSPITAAVETVPVLIWYNKRPMSLPALQLVDKESFGNILNSYLSEKPYTLIFNDESLSTEDFSTRDASGRNIFEPLYQQIHKDNKVINYFSTVESPLEVLKNVSKDLGSPLENLDFDAGETLKPKSGSFGIINLDEATSEENREELLANHVKSILNVYNLAKSKNPNTLVIYTAQNPSWFMVNQIKNRQTRHLLAVEDGNRTTGGQYYDERITVVMDGPIVETWSAGKKTDSVTYTSLTFTSTAPNANESVILTATASNGEFKLYFKQSFGYWSLATIDSPKVSNITVQDVTVPVGFSYHCSTLIIRAGETVVVLPHIQVQPRFSGDVYPNSADTSIFSDTYDCVGFTSPAIWSGLVVTVIMGIILTLGLTMMLNVKTMDRFDDPKGKTITVSATD